VSCSTRLLEPLASAGAQPVCHPPLVEVFRLAEELARFLRHAQEEDRRRADRAKELLGQRPVRGRSPSPHGIVIVH
jgi:hypothetical protein